MFTVSVMPNMLILCSAQYWVHGKRKVGRPKGEASNIVSRPKKKRGRRRLFTSTKLETECEAVEGEANMETVDDVEIYSLPRGLGSDAAGGKYHHLVTFSSCIKTRGPLHCKIHMEMQYFISACY